MLWCQTTGPSLTQLNSPFSVRSGDLNMSHPLHATHNPMAKLRVLWKLSRDCSLSAVHLSECNLSTWTGAINFQRAWELVQHSTGRCCKTLVPMSGSFLQPWYSMAEDTSALNTQKQHQKYYYDHPQTDCTWWDRSITTPDQFTYMEHGWMHSPRSYEVKVEVLDTTDGSFSSLQIHSDQRWAGRTGGDIGATAPVSYIILQASCFISGITCSLHLWTCYLLTW